MTRAQAGALALSIVGVLVLGLLVAWLTWTYAFTNVDRGMVKMLWGDATGTGGFGGQ